MLMVFPKMFSTPIRAAISVATLMLMVCGCSDENKYPTSIKVVARPGSVAVIPFRQPVEGSPKRALSLVPARAWIKPDSLSQGARVIQSNLSLHGSGNVSGQLLIFLPPTAHGDITFSVSASGDGRGQRASIVSFKTKSMNVTLTVDGDEVAESPPSLAGDWHKKKDIWNFSAPPVRKLTKRYATGEKKVEPYEIYPDGAGRWYLVCVNPKDGAYWIELSKDGSLLVDRPGEKFQPSTPMTRVPPK